MKNDKWIELEKILTTVNRDNGFRIYFNYDPYNKMTFTKEKVENNYLKEVKVSYHITAGDKLWDVKDAHKIIEALRQLESTLNMWGKVYGASDKNISGGEITLNEEVQGDKKYSYFEVSFYYDVEFKDADGFVRILTGEDLLDTIVWGIGGASFGEPHAKVEFKFASGPATIQPLKEH